MTFTEAIRVVLSKYATFSGRAQRSEYWWFALFAWLVTIAALIVDGILDTTYLVQVLAVLALLLPSIAVTIRRLHDTGRSGWWYLIGFIPLVGGIVLLVFMVQDSEGDNRYGPSAKYGRTDHETAPSQP